MSELRGLDNWITGHYGADAPSERRDDSLEDQGLLTVQSAMDYLEPSEDEDDIEAHQILRCSEYLIERDYRCHFCGNYIGNRKDKYCSKSCYRAAMEGL